MSSNSQITFGPLDKFVSSNCLKFAKVTNHAVKLHEIWDTYQPWLKTLEIYRKLLDTISIFEKLPDTVQYDM